MTLCWFSVKWPQSAPSWGSNAGRPIRNPPRSYFNRTKLAWRNIRPDAVNNAT